jgi:hypothetical protein
MDEPKHESTANRKVACGRNARAKRHNPSDSNTYKNHGADDARADALQNKRNHTLLEGFNLSTHKLTQFQFCGIGYAPFLLCHAAAFM